MPLNFSKFYTKTNLINLLISLIPASFIAGNLVLNLNILLLIITTFVYYKHEIFKIDFCILDKLLLLLFAYILIVGFYNNLYSYYFENKIDFTIAIKTFFYLRYLILYFVVRFLVNNDLINFKFFFISSGFCSLFVCLDLVYQYSFGEDIFGFKASSRRLSGPFGDELIAGSYLQRFSIFSFFLFPIFLKITDKKIFYTIFFTLSLLLSFSFIIAGNRMPIILFLLMLTILFLFEKKARKLLVLFTITASVIFFISINFNINIKKHFGHFKTKIVTLVNTFSEANKVTEEEKKNLLIKMNLLT